MRPGMAHFVNKKMYAPLFVLFTFLANFNLNSLFSQFKIEKLYRLNSVVVE